MTLDLLQLHNETEDKNVRELLRVYSALPKYSYCLNENKNKQAIKINSILRQINEKLKKELSLNWEEKWLESTNYIFARSTAKDWFLGRASIPLIAIQKLKEFNCVQEVNEIMNYANYFCSNTGKVFKIPAKINANLAYLAGAILGDGHLNKLKYRIEFYSSNEALIKKFEAIFNNEFETGLHYLKEKPRKNRKQKFRFHSNSKPIFRLFHKFFEIPRAKKSHKIIVPELIKKSSLEIKKAFIKGVFETDGGRRGKTLGFTSASKQFVNEVAELLKEFGISIYKDKWINKLNNIEYYGFKLKSGQNCFLLHGYPSGLRGQA